MSYNILQTAGLAPAVVGQPNSEDNDLGTERIQMAEMASFSTRLASKRAPNARDLIMAESVLLAEPLLNTLAARNPEQYTSTHKSQYVQPVSQSQPLQLPQQSVFDDDSMEGTMLSQKDQLAHVRDVPQVKRAPKQSYFVY